MKKLVLLCLCLMLALFFCACGEKENPYYGYYPPTNDTDTTPDDTVDKPDDTPDKQEDNIPDIPNIDHEILDADRHLGNTPENYSSEDTMLVEYGNRIYHCYNDERQIMEYCTENGKTKALGIYGTDLSVYKNVLYYIDNVDHDIHAYNLATGTDSVWMSSLELVLRVPEKVYAYSYFHELVVSDYGVFVLFDANQNRFVHLGFDKKILFYDATYDKGYGDLIPLGDNSIAASEWMDKGISVYTPSTKTIKHSSLDDLNIRIRYFSDGKLYYYDYDNYTLLGFDTSTMTSFQIFTTSFESYLSTDQYKYGDFFFSSNANNELALNTSWKISSTTKIPVNLNFNIRILCLTFTSDNMVYGLAHDSYGDYSFKGFKTDIDFKEITYLN